jgi:undecaprenyl-diphosphatase
MERLSLLARLAARDRKAFDRWVAAETSTLVRVFWKGITQVGGATFTIAVALATIFFGAGEMREVGLQAAAVLLTTHLIAQGLKRTVTRPRPSGLSFEALVEAPDQFSFPSGHAIAASSLAFVYAWHVPTLAPGLLLIATLVAVSRVRLGVHYPGDVIAGQAIAFGGALVVLLAW